MAGGVDDLQGQAAQVERLAALQLLVDPRLAGESLPLNGLDVQAVGQNGGVCIALQSDGAAGMVAVAVRDQDAHDGRPADLPDVGHAGGVVFVLVITGVDEHGGAVSLHEVDVGRGDAEGLAPVGHLVDSGFNFQGWPPK